MLDLRLGGNFVIAQNQHLVSGGGGPCGRSNAYVSC